MVSLSSMQGSLRRVRRFVNRHGGTLRTAGWVAFTKTYSREKWLISHLPPTFAIIIDIPRPLRLCFWRPRVPVPHVPASHTWCPQVPRLASPSPKSPHTRPDVPVPLLYTAPPRPRNGTVGQRLDKQIIYFSFILPRNLLQSLFQAANISLRCTLCTDVVLFFCSFFSKTSASARERARSATTSPEREESVGSVDRLLVSAMNIAVQLPAIPRKKSLIADNSNFF